MKLCFKQRFFSWFDSYDIYHEDGSVAYTVEGKLSWGHCLHILDPYGEHIATVKQQVLTFVPKMICVFLSLIICGDWILNNILSFIQDLYSRFGEFVG